MPPSKHWQLTSKDPSLQKRLAAALGLLPATAQLLINRGITTVESASQFLSPSLKNLPSPFFLPDMERAANRIVEAITKNEKMVIYGDYDVDGITSAALFSHFFREIGIPITGYIPDRLKEGYGINTKALEQFKDGGVRLVITADCGTKSHEELLKGREMGLDIIVTDHHIIEKDPPPCFAFVNPQISANEEGKELAGCGVIFFLLMALRQKLRESGFFKEKEPNLKQHLDLVALGTIADMAPMTGINRTLVRFGLEALSQTKKPGLIALKEIVGIQNQSSLNPSDIGFKLAPRLNAGGRIAKADLGLELLCTADLERASKLAKILDQCNQDRQTLQEKFVREAQEQAAEKMEKRGLVVASANWHPGIVGLVASKLVEQFYKPSVALHIEGGFAKGSARSISGINITQILEGCKNFLENFGGHSQAAGLTLKTENLLLFEERFETLLNEKSEGNSWTPTLPLDDELQLEEIEGRLLEEMEALKPFGIQNPEPLFLGRGFQLGETRIVGKNHLKLSVFHENKPIFGGIGFNLGVFHPLKVKNWDIAFIPQWNTFQNVKTIQLKIRDLKFDTVRKNG